ncbi:MAG: hypothetical protein ACE5OS_13620 [Anaerolineae bacterium]
MEGRFADALRALHHLGRAPLLPRHRRGRRGGGHRRRAPPSHTRSGRSGEELALWSAALLGLACLGCGAATLWAAGGKRTLFSGLAPLFVIGTAMAVTQFVAVTHGLWPIGGMLAGLAVGEGPVLWAVMRYGLAIVAGLALATGATAYLCQR